MASYSIRSSTIRLGIFISTLVIAAILTVQLIWLNKIYHTEQKEFDQGVIRAIRGLYGDLESPVYTYSHLNELIESPEPHLFLARLGSQLPAGILQCTRFAGLMDASAILLNQHGERRNSGYRPKLFSATVLPAAPALTHSRC